MKSIVPYLIQSPFTFNELDLPGYGLVLDRLPLTRGLLLLDLLLDTLLLLQHFEFLAQVLPVALSQPRSGLVRCRNRPIRTLPKCLRGPKTLSEH